MKDILIVASFATIPDEASNCRFRYLANLLKDKMNVTLVLSSFSHINKCQRDIHNINREEFGYNLTFIKECGYDKNISLKRFKSHNDMANNLKIYLNKLDKKPDVIYCALPSLQVGNVCANFCKKNDVKFIIDIQDLWPEAFKMIYNIPLIYKPITMLADKVYSSADGIIAVSKTYRNRAIKKNRKLRGIVGYLGTDLSIFDKIPKKEFNDDKIRLVYIGTLGHSYNLKLVIDALNYVNDDRLELLVLGDGPLMQEFEEYAISEGVKADFMGRLPYEEMVSILKGCDIALNPISKGAAQSIINKVCDYAAAGLPVISTQENEEYRKLIKDYNIGYNCKNSSFEVAYRISELSNSEELRKKLGNNNRKLARMKFDRSKTYRKIVKYIKRVVDNEYI